MANTSSILLVWFALLLLLGLTAMASTVLSGSIGLTVGLSIATAKASLVAWRYMHLDDQSGLERLAALGAVAWVTILFAMTTLDYLTR